MASKTGRRAVSSSSLENTAGSRRNGSGGGGQIDNNQLHSEHTHSSRLGKCKQEDALNYLILILLSILTFCITYHSLTTIYDEAMQDVGTQHLVS